MHNLLRVGLTAVLLTALVAAPGAADEIDPIDMTLYLHGAEQIGELELPDTWLNNYRQLSEDEPTGEDAKSFQSLNYVAGPNTACSGNGLLPTWGTWFEGTIVEDLTVVLHTLALPGSELHVELFADVSSNSCNESYVPPVASTTVELEAGEAETTAVLSGLDVEVLDNLVLMAYVVDTSQARLFYDSVDAPSRIELTCVPRFEGAETCLG